MKLFYAVQATGNGHISRAAQLYPYLKKLGDVDFFVSGNNSNLAFEFPVRYRSKGCSLYFSKCGGLNYLDIMKNIKPLAMYKDAAALPLKQYDVVINDFDFVTSLACKLQNIPSVQLGHQASFQSDHTPRPEKKSLVGETILKHYARATKHIGFHFQAYDSFVLPPVIKETFIHADVRNLNHITVYLPSFQQHCLEEAFAKLKDLQFHWFLDGIKEVTVQGNITYYPVSQELFNESLITCFGLITGGGFETPAEALYLGKKLMSIPIKNHYEQQCNSAALKQMGVTVLDDVDDNFANEILAWCGRVETHAKVVSNPIPETLQMLLDTYPVKR